MLSPQMFHRLLAVALFLLPGSAQGNPAYKFPVPGFRISPEKGIAQGFISGTRSYQLLLYLHVLLCNIFMPHKPSVMLYWSGFYVMKNNQIFISVLHEARKMFKMALPKDSEAQFISGKGYIAFHSTGHKKLGARCEGGNVSKCLRSLSNTVCRRKVAWIKIKPTGQVPVFCLHRLKHL